MCLLASSYQWSPDHGSALCAGSARDTVIDLRGRRANNAHRDECPDEGMLAVARGVLERLHARVFGMLARTSAGFPATPPGTPDRGLAAWDVRSVLRALRAQVLRAGAHRAPTHLECCQLS